MKLLLIFEFLIYFIFLSVIIKNIYGYTIRKTRFFVVFLVYFCLLLMTQFLEDRILMNLYILFCLLEIFALYFAFSDAKLNSIFYTYIIFYSTNTVIGFFITHLGNIKYENTIWVEIIVNIVVFVSCSIFSFSKIKVKIQQIKDWTPVSAKRLLLAILIVDMFLVLLAQDEIYHADSAILLEFTQKYILIAAILFLIIAGFLVCTMISSNQLKQLTRNYEQQIRAQADHYQLLAESTYELRRFKHDFKNMSIALEKLLEDEDAPQSLQLFKEYNHHLESSDISSVLFDTGNGIADALLMEKQQKAASCNAQIKFQGVIPSNFLSPTDLCVILGNTLDNAIEACEKLQSEDKTMISVICNCNSGFLFLTITNPISEKVVISNNHIATTKEDKTLHGFGLYSLSSVVKKYHGDMELKATDSQFTAEINLPLVSL